VETYDDAAYDRFCSDLVNAGFSPDGEYYPTWIGPIRESLRPLTDATQMKIHFYPGWPLRYAHVSVEGIRTEHDADGLLCLWAEDDPGQIDGRELEGLWKRVDEWALRAQQGFQTGDEGLDAHRLYIPQSSTFWAELPLQDMVSQGNRGYTTEISGYVRGSTLFIGADARSDSDHGPPTLKGEFYLSNRIERPPRSFDEVRAALTRRQWTRLNYGLVSRSPVEFPEPSGGHDFIVLTWPRHGEDHDAIVLGVSGAGDALRTEALPVSANDLQALRRRAGPDAELLASRTVLIAGVGSVGGYVALALASSGVGAVRLHDSDRLSSSNLVRHVASRNFVGQLKTAAVKAAIEERAPWTVVSLFEALSYDPAELRDAVAGVDLVIDCTGALPMTAALAEVCRRIQTPFIAGAVFHQGALVRVQRQASGDTPIAGRRNDPRYHNLPPDDEETMSAGFLELGCTARVNNASPAAVMTASTEIVSAAVDFMTGRKGRPDERIVVITPLEPPFHRVCTLDPFEYLTPSNRSDEH
jgi:molybdopterin/thiamine biosynthesis adenylyltransferase